MGLRPSLLLILASSLAPLAGSAQVNSREGGTRAPLLHQAEVFSALALLRAGDPQSRETSQERLAGLGRSVVPTLVAVLADPHAAVDELGPLLDGPAQVLIIDVLRERPSGEVLPPLHGICQGELPLEHRRRFVKILGQLGGPTSLEPLIGLVAGMPPVHRQLETIQRELESALTSILRRHPGAYPALSAQTDELEQLLQVSVSRAIGAAGSGQGLPLLERLLGRTLELDRAVLQAVGQLDPTDPDCLNACPALLSWHLTSSDPEARRFAATSLGRHGGLGQIDGLLALLDDSDPRVQRAAEWSLRELTGMRLGADPGAWSAWVQRELAWYRTHAGPLISSATKGQPSLAFRALRELSDHPLFRRELAAELAPVLDREELPLAVAACTALARLGGPTARAPLEETLGDQRSEVAQAAASALRSIARG